MRRLAPATLLLLAACGRHDDAGTSITFNSDEGSGNIVADGGGSRASIRFPGLSGTIKLPRIQMKADQVDLNGVHLYPGSTVTSFNIDAHGDSDESKGAVQLSFDSPADPAKVRDWFANRLPAAAFVVHPEGAGLAGKTDDGKPFRLELAPGTHGHARGTITTG
jgi:hypothetical protein